MARARSQPQRVVPWPKIILLAVERIESKKIAHHVSPSRRAVKLWSEHFLALRASSPETEAPRPSRLPAISNKRRAAAVGTTLQSRSPHATHWKNLLVAKAQCVNETKVRRDLEAARTEPVPCPNTQDEPRSSVCGKVEGYRRTLSEPARGNSGTARR